MTTWVETICCISSLSRPYSVVLQGQNPTSSTQIWIMKRCYSDSLDGAGETLPHGNILKNTEKQWGLIPPGANQANAQRRVKPGR